MKNENNGVPNLINLIQHLLIVKFYDDCVAEQFEKPTLDLIDNIVFLAIKASQQLKMTHDEWLSSITHHLFSSKSLLIQMLTNNS